MSKALINIKFKVCLRKDFNSICYPKIMSNYQRKPKFLRAISFVFQLALKKMQKILISSIPEGSIIDIGGGGEGIIAQIGKKELQL